MRQIAWSAIAIIGAIATILVIRNHRVLFRYTYLAGLVAIVLLLLPLVPGLGPRGQRRTRVDRLRRHRHVPAR